MAVTVPIGEVRIVNGLGSWTCTDAHTQATWAAPDGYIVVAFQAYAYTGDQSERRHSLPAEVASDGRSVTIFLHTFEPGETMNAGAWASLLAVPA